MHEIAILKQELEETHQSLQERNHKALETEIFLKERLEAAALHSQEFKDKLDAADQKIDELSREILEDQRNLENLLRGEDLSHLCQTLDFDSNEIHNISNSISKLKYLFGRLGQNSERILGEKNEKIQYLIRETEREKQAFEMEKEYFRSEINAKEDIIRMNKAKIETFAVNLESKVKENENFREQTHKTANEKQQILQEIKDCQTKNLELLQENNDLDSKIREISNENLKLTAETSHLRQLITKFDSETAEKMVNFRTVFSQLESENQAIKQELFSLRANMGSNDKKLIETENELNELKTRNQELTIRLRELIHARDLKFMDFENVISNLQEEKSSLESSQNLAQGEFDKLREELEKLQQERLKKLLGLVLKIMQD